MPSEKSTFNNIPINNLRKTFYEALDDKTHDRYMNMLFSFFLLIQNPLSKVQFNYEKYTMKFSSHKNKSLCIFGGALFYFLFKEAGVLGVFDNEDENVINDFLRTKTIDIDATNSLIIKPSIKIFNEAKKEEIMKNFSEQYHTFFTEQIIEIIKKNSNLEKEVIEIGKIMNLNGHNFKEDDEPINPFIGPNGVFSVSLQLQEEEIRPQLNTCIGDVKNCDHIFEVLSRLEEFKMEQFTLYKISKEDSFYGRNIVELCVENIDRMYREVIKKLGKPPYTKESVTQIFKQEFEDTPLKKTKYLQGYYRVRIIYTILNNILENPSDKYINLLNIFELNKKTFYTIRIPFRSTFVKMMCSKNTQRKREDYLNKLYKSKLDCTHEEIRELLKMMLDLWIEVHRNLVKDYGIPNVTGLKYKEPPVYSSDNSTSIINKSSKGSKPSSQGSKPSSKGSKPSSSKKSKKKVIIKKSSAKSEDSINLTKPDWNKKITNKQLIKLQRNVLGKVMPVTPSTKSILIKRIKKTIN